MPLISIKILCCVLILTVQSKTIGIKSLGDTLRLFIYHHQTEAGSRLIGFENLEDKKIFSRLLSVNGLGPKWALIFAVPPVIIGIIIALVRIAEMTFLPVILNYFRLQLNNKERIWSMGTDSYSDIEIGYVIQPNEKVDGKNNASLESKMNDEVTVKIGKL